MGGGGLRRWSSMLISVWSKIITGLFDITAFMNFSSFRTSFCSVCLGFMICLRLVLVGMVWELLRGKTQWVTDVMERRWFCCVYFVVIAGGQISHKKGFQISIQTHLLYIYPFPLLLYFYFLKSSTSQEGKCYRHSCQHISICECWCEYLYA